MQKNKVLFVSMASENKQKILKDAFNEIGTSRKVIKTSKIAINDGLLVNEFFSL